MSAAAVLSPTSQQGLCDLVAKPAPLAVKFLEQVEPLRVHGETNQASSQVTLGPGGSKDATVDYNKDW